MRPYSILNALPPEAFLKPEDFVTEFDTRNPDYADEQYRKGLEISQEYDRVVIRENGTWAAECGPYYAEADIYLGNAAYSYEGIGYHGETAALLRGFLDGPAPIDVRRRQEDYSVITTRIKERATTHYGESRTACGELGPLDKSTTNIPNVTCPECIQAVHRPV